MQINDENNNTKIVDQFTKQAIPLTELPGHLDSILDVACDPGLVAKVAKKLTGIDITGKIIEQAEGRQKELNLTNSNCVHQWRL